MATSRTNIQNIKPEHFVDDSSTIQCLYTEEYTKEDLIDLIRQLADYMKNQEEKANEYRSMLQAQLSELKGENTEKQGYIGSLLKQIDDLKALFNEELEKKNKELEQLSMSQQQIKIHCGKLDSQLYEQRVVHQKYSNLQRQLTEKQEEIQAMAQNQQKLNQQLEKQFQQACQLKQQIQQAHFNILQLTQKLQALEAENKELSAKNSCLQEQIDQTYIRSIIKIQDRFSDQSLKSSSNHDNDDKMKMKEIAENYKFEAVKPQNIFMTPVSDISEQFDNVSQKFENNSKKYTSNIKTNGPAEFIQSSKKHQTQLKIIQGTQKSSIAHETPKSKELIRRRTSTQFRDDWVKNSSFGFLKKQLQAKSNLLKQTTQKLNILEEELLDKMDRIVELEGTLQMIEDEQQQISKNQQAELEYREQLIKSLEKQSAQNRIEFIQQKSQLLLKIQEIENKAKHYKQAVKESQLICLQYQNIITQQKDNLSKRQTQCQAIQAKYHHLLQANSLKNKANKLALINSHLITYSPQMNNHGIGVPLERDIGLQFPELDDKETQSNNHGIGVPLEKDISLQFPELDGKKCDIETQTYPRQQNLEYRQSSLVFEKELDRINRESNQIGFDDNPFEIREFLTVNQNSSREWLSFQEQRDCPFGKDHHDQSIKEGKENIMNYSNRSESKSLLISFRDIVNRYKAKSSFKSSILKHPIFMPSSQEQSFKKTEHLGSNDGSNQSMYLITCFKKNRSQKDTMLLWNEGIISLNQQKALLMKKNQRKIINDPGSYILGNCEITVNLKTIKIRRNDKRTYLFGDLEDADWYINSVRVFDGK